MRSQRPGADVPLDAEDTATRRKRWNENKIPAEGTILGPVPLSGPQLSSTMTGDSAVSSGWPPGHPEQR